MSLLVSPPHALKPLPTVHVIRSAIVKYVAGTGEIAAHAQVDVTSNPGQVSMLGDKVCQEVCNTAKCVYDGMDCVSKSQPFPMFVALDASEPFLGTIEKPFKSLSEALTQLQGDYVTIYLLTGVHSLHYADNTNGTPLASITALEITIETALCSEMQIVGCSLSPAVIQLTEDLVSFDVLYSLTLRNVGVQGGFPLKSGCLGAETCTYCPALSLDLDLNIYINDRGQSIDLTTYAEQSLCERYHFLVLFDIHPEANLTLHNVTFTNIRHQPLALISSNCGNLALANVTFTNITTMRNGQGVVMWTPLISKEPYYCGSFLYNTGTVELLNNGYEPNYDFYAAGFASLSAVYVLNISFVTFRYNNAYIGEHRTDYTSSLISVQNARQVLISDCVFEGNLADVGAGLYIQSELTMPIINDNGVSREHALLHIWIVRCQFVRNYARVGAALEVYFSAEHQNVMIDNCTFVRNVVRELNIFGVTGADVTEGMELGKTVQLLVSGVKVPVRIPPSIVTLQWAVITDNRAPRSASFVHLGVLVLSNCTFERNGEPVSEADHTNWALQGYADLVTSYAILPPASLAGMVCNGHVHSLHILNYTATFSNFTSNYCSIGSPGLCIHEGLGWVSST